MFPRPQRRVMVEISHLGLSVGQLLVLGTLTSCESLQFLQPNCKKKLLWPELRAELIFVHKHKYLESNFTGVICPLGSNKSKIFPH